MSGFCFIINLSAADIKVIKGGYMNEAEVLLKELEELKMITDNAILILKKIISQETNNCTECLKKDDFDPDEYLKDWIH